MPTGGSEEEAEGRGGSREGRCRVLPVARGSDAGAARVFQIMDFLYVGRF
jgi:hypothetical protein